MAIIGANESPFGPSPKAVAAMIEKAALTARYADAEGELLKAQIAKIEGVTPDQVDGVICCDSHIAGGSGGSASQWAPRPYFDPPYDSELGLTLINARGLIEHIDRIARAQEELPPAFAAVRRARIIQPALPAAREQDDGQGLEALRGDLEFDIHLAREKAPVGVFLIMAADEEIALLGDADGISHGFLPRLIDAAEPSLICVRAKRPAQPLARWRMMKLS
jgi:hypothetical protein